MTKPDRCAICDGPGDGLCLRCRAVLLLLPRPYPVSPRFEWVRHWYGPVIAEDGLGPWPKARAVVPRYPRWRLWGIPVAVALAIGAVIVRLLSRAGVEL